MPSCDHLLSCARFPIQRVGPVFTPRNLFNLRAKAPRPRITPEPPKFARGYSVARLRSMTEAVLKPGGPCNSYRVSLGRVGPFYANKIEVDEIQGAIHQTSGVKINSSQGKIKIPTVSTSVIYADEIKANSVVADSIHVRKIERR